MYRVGKHAAGRELDGKVYDEYPVINLPLFPRA
jgi:protein gp37